MHQVVPANVNGEQPKKNFQQMFNQYTKEEDLKGQQAQLQQRIYDLEAELQLKEKALNEAQAKLKYQTVKNWHIKQKYKRENCLVQRI